MKYKYVFSAVMLFVILSTAIHARSGFEAVSAVSAGVDLKIIALFFFFAFAAVLPVFHLWNDSQNGS